MKKLFLIIGICSFVAAGAIVFAHGRDDPFSMTPKWWLAKKELHGVIGGASFSPNGEQTFIEIGNQSGELSEVDTYLYSLNEKRLRQCEVERYGGGMCWAPDSLRIAFNRYAPYTRYLREGCIYDIERNVVTERFSIMMGGGRQTWSPDGEWLLFHHQGTGKAYTKQAGKPVWIEIPQDIIITYWSRNSASLIGFGLDRKTLHRFELAEGSLHILTSVDEYPVRPLLYCSPYANEVFALAKRKEDRGCTILLRINTDTGQITPFDTGLDPETASLNGVFIPCKENLLYFTTYQFQVEGKPAGEPPKLVFFNMATSEMETVLTGEYRFCDYCGKRDMFAVTSKEDDHKKLYLFDVKTRSFEQVFP